MKKSIIVLLLSMFLVFPAAGQAGCFSLSDIVFCSSSIEQGDIGLIRIRAGEGEKPRITWLKKNVILSFNEQRAEWVGFLGTDLTTAPGLYRAQITANPDEVTLKIQVTEKDYGVRTLTLPKNMVDLDSKTLERVRKEARAMKSLWEEPVTEVIWQSSFIRPLEGEIVGPFGRKSIINGQPRSPHSGVDLRAPKGTPVKAMNDGHVVLIAEHYFSGKSVVIDHGGGIQSMYFHLDRIMVEEGETIARGRVLGQVGSTGRSTGPHLHFSVRVNEARVDPMRLIEVSRQIE